MKIVAFVIEPALIRLILAHRQSKQEMRLQPGDALIVDSLIVDGEKVWVIKPAADIETPWFGSLRSYAKGKRHDMKFIRKSVAEARSRGEI